MENSEISTHSELALRIIYLKSIKIKQEEEIKITFKELANSIHPVTMVKESLHELSLDKEVQFDLTKIGLNEGANFIIEKVFGKNKSVKGFVSTLLVEALSSTLINRNLPKIISSFTKFLQRKPKEEIDL